VTLKAAAGAFGEARTIETDEWVVPETTRRLEPGMFVAQVVGRSMEPRIPDGSWCLFRAPVAGSREGKIVLVEHRDVHDPETGGSYTVKRYRRKNIVDSDGHDRDEIHLEPENPEFEPIVLRPHNSDEVRVVAELVEVLAPAAGSLAR